MVNSIVLTFKTLDEYSQQLAKGACLFCFFLGFVEFVATTFRLGKPKRDNSCIAQPKQASRFCQKTVEESQKDLQVVSLQPV